MNATTPKIDKSAVVRRLEKLLREKIVWMAKHCYPDRVEHHLGEIGKMIRSAQELGVAELASVNFESATCGENQFLIRQIQSLRTLGMEREVYEIFCGMMREMGVPEHFYVAPPPPPQRAEGKEIGWDGDV